MIGRYLPGDLQSVAGHISYLLAAILAIQSGWLPRKGSNWFPDEQAVPKTFTASATGVIATIFAIEYKYLTNPLLTSLIAYSTASFLVLSLVGLFWTNFRIKRYGLPAKRRSWFLKREVAVVRIGGDQLTPEAEEIRAVTNKPISVIFEESGYDLYLVFTQASVAKVHLFTQITYLLFEIFGPLALCGAGMLSS